jgi:hypothetical protein
MIRICTPLFLNRWIMERDLPYFRERIPTQSGSSFANVGYFQPPLALAGSGQELFQLLAPAIGAWQPQQRPVLDDGGEAGSFSFRGTYYLIGLAAVRVCRGT